MFVGLDPSLTAFGMASYSPMDSSYAVSTLVSGPAPTLTGRIWRYDQILGDVIERMPGKVDGVCVEGYSFASKGGMQFDRVEFGGILRHYLITDANLPVVEVPPTCLKLFVVGKGGGKGVDKAAVRIAAFKRYGIEFADDDQCDAYVLARMAACLAGVEEPQTDFQRAALAKLGKFPTQEPLPF